MEEATTAYSLKDLCEECGLKSAMEEKNHKPTLQLLDRGTKTINHILINSVGKDNISKKWTVTFWFGIFD